MQLDQLRYFLETARRGHLGQAARALHVSPSAVSQGIARLEEELSCELFQKSGRKLVLTERGADLVDRAADVLGRVDGLLEDSRTSADHGPAVRIAATHGIASEYVAAAVGSLWAKRELSVAEVTTVRSAEVVRMAAAGEIDLGLCFNPLPHPEVEIEELLTGPLELVVRRDHPALPARLTHVPEILRSYRAVLPKGRAGIESCEKHPALLALSGRPQVECYFDSYDVAAQLVATSDCWTLFPDFFARRWATRLKTLPRDKRWQASFILAAIRPVSRTPRPALSRLARAVADAVRAQ